MDEIDTPRINPRDYWKHKNRWIRVLITTLAIAIAYGITSKLSVDFAALPGKITAVWLPSGMTLALVAWLGTSAIPGIFLGSVMGISRDLLTMTPPLSMPSFFFFNLVCAVANCLQPIVAVAIIKKLTGEKPSFDQVSNVTSFFVAAIIAPSVSATLGITGLGLIGSLPWTNYGISWLTWWLASVMAHLLFTPPLLLGHQWAKEDKTTRWGEGILILGISLGLSWITFVLGYSVEYALIPVLLWAVFRLGGFAASILVSLISAIAIVTTTQGFGLFMPQSIAKTLLLLQSFIAVCSVTTLMLSAVLNECKAAETALEQTLTTLEQQVLDRTAELQESKAILDAFFAMAPVGMSIVDHHLRFVQINRPLAEMNGASIEDHLGKTIWDTIPHLAPDLEPIYQQVLATGQPILEREESGYLANGGEIGTWLTSYFPIRHSHQVPYRVGVIVMDISDRKRLEEQLRQQARLDELAKIGNRLQFNETFEMEWRRCSRTCQPLSLILIDIDYFKGYNDTYGHLAGDECIRQFAQMLFRTVNRPGDLVARYGGEEFVVLLPEINPEGASHIASLIHHGIYQLQIPHATSTVAAHVTVSMGIATCIPSDPLQMPDLVQSADTALYESKRQGRDRATQVIL